MEGRRILNPYIIIAALAIVLGAYVKGRYDGNEICEASTLREERIAVQARDEALRVTAKAISEIEVKNVTIRQTLEREIREKPVYLECKHTPDGLRLVNAAITNQLVGDSKLPAAHPAK